MGSYDTVEGQQIKSTPHPGGDTYVVGDNIQLPDGCHLTNEGAFIVFDQVIIAACGVVFSKWGDILVPSMRLLPWNEVNQAIEAQREGISIEDLQDPLS